jgi:hypothetical protein
MNEQSKKMNDLIRRATGHAVTSTEDHTEPPEAESIGGKADGGEGGTRAIEPFDMNVELRRATGRPGYIDEKGRAWA